MSFYSLVLIALLSIPVLFAAVYWLTGRILTPRSDAHFVSVCLLFPAACLTFAVWYANVPPPTPEEAQLIADGLVGDSGPHSFVILFLFGLLPTAIYLPVSLVLYWILGSRRTG